ncbi:MAG: right-handed parallel beta-helix repeat-containing protein, partial [Candidatus Nanoarchaeia archaeon]
MKKIDYTYNTSKSSTEREDLKILLSAVIILFCIALTIKFFNISVLDGRAVFNTSPIDLDSKNLQENSWVNSNINQTSSINLEQADFRTLEVCNCDSCSSCQNCINLGNYNLINITRDITANSSPCIVINKSNVILSGNGRRINNGAINILGSPLVSNVTVEQIIINNTNGITLGDANNIKLINNSIFCNSPIDCDKGIYGYWEPTYQGATNVSIENNTIIGFPNGLFLRKDVNWQIKNNNFSNCMSDCITVIDSENISFENNSGKSIWVENSLISATNHFLDENTTIDFEGANFTLSNVYSPPADPFVLQNLSAYVNAQGIYSSGWLFLNMSYPEPDFAEDTIILARNSGTWELNCSNFANYCGIDTENNKVYANITDFGSIFAPLGGSYLVYDCTNITNPGMYYLMNNISTDTSQACINISSNNVIFDGLSNTIYNEVGQATAAAIYFFSTLNNITIRNVVINNFGYGVNFNYGAKISNATIENSQFYDNIYTGISVVGDNIPIRNNRIESYPWAQYPLYLSVNNSIVENNTIINGVNLCYLGGSNNIFINNYFDGGASSDIFTGGENNTFYNTNLASGNSRLIANFTVGGGSLKIKGVQTSEIPTDPENYTNIGKYINLSAYSGFPWINLNISYRDEDVEDISESTLRIAKYNGVWETNCDAFANNCGVDTENNIVYANITGFGSIFAPLGKPGIPVSDCINITHGGIYYLTENLSNKIVDVCINITASNVFFDGQNNYVDGAEGSNIGVLVTQAKNVTIKNLEVKEWRTGVNITDTIPLDYENITLEGVTIHSNTDYGVWVSGVTFEQRWIYLINSKIINNKYSWNTIGVYLHANYSAMFNCTIANNSRGLDAKGIGLWADNTFSNNTEYDIKTEGLSSLQAGVNFDHATVYIHVRGTGATIKSEKPTISDPPGYKNIGHYLNITNLTGPGDIYLEFYYSDEDLNGINENTLSIWKYNGSWSTCSEFGYDCGVDVVNNKVYGYVNNSGSIFAPLGEILAGICECDSCENCTNKLNDPSCTEVKLTADIIDQSGTCINNPEN